MTTDGGQSVEEMMSRLKRRFKAAGLDTKGDSFAEPTPVQDESRCVTQLKTYVKLCKTMGASFVINEKARQEVFDAIRMHSVNSQVMKLALNCLNLLLTDAQQDPRKAGQITFEVYDGAYTGIVSAGIDLLQDEEYAIGFLNFMRSLLMENAVGPEIGKSSVQGKTLVQQASSFHPANDNISNLAENVLSLITQNEDFANQGSRMGNMGKPMQRMSTMDEFADMAGDDLIDFEDFNDGNLLAGDEFGDLAMGNNDLVSDMNFGMGGNNMGMGMGGNVSGEMVSKGELEEAQRLIAQYTIDIHSLSSQLSQVQLAYQADQEVHRSFVQRLQDTETQHNREKLTMQQTIGTLEQQNKTLREEVHGLKDTMVNQTKALEVKNREFEQLKTLIENKSDQMRNHYLALKKEYENVRGLNEILEEASKSAKSRVSSLEEQLHTKTREVEEANRSLVIWQDKCQEAQTKLVNLKGQDQVAIQKQNEAYQELQTTHGKLVNQHQNLIQLHNQLKQQFVQLKMNFANQQQKSNQNVEVYKLQHKVQGLEREKGELTAMVDMLLKQIE